MRYEVRVADRALRVETAPEGRFLVEGSVVAHDVREIVPGRHWSILIDGGAHEVVLLRGGTEMRLLVDGSELVVTATDERALAARRGRSAIVGGRREVRAPMPGLLKAVHVAEGDLVEPNAALATLEAMKMENELRAPARARVQRVVAAAGSKVESGSLIVVLIEEPA